MRLPPTYCWQTRHNIRVVMGSTWSFPSTQISYDSGWNKWCIPITSRTQIEPFIFCRETSPKATVLLPWRHCLQVFWDRIQTKKKSEQRLMLKSSWETNIKQWAFLLADYLKDVKLTFSSAQWQWNHNQWTILGRKSILNGIKDEGFAPRVVSLERWHPHLMTTTSLL